MSWIGALGSHQEIWLRKSGDGEHGSTLSSSGNRSSGAGFDFLAIEFDVIGTSIGVDGGGMHMSSGHDVVQSSAGDVYVSRGVVVDVVVAGALGDVVLDCVCIAHLLTPISVLILL